MQHKTSPRIDTMGGLNKQCSSLQTLIARYPSDYRICDANPTDLMDMLKICENSAIDIRKSAEFTQNSIKNDSKKIGTKNLFDITVSLTDGRLMVRVPYTFNRKAPDCFTLADEVGDAIQRYICENNVNLFHFVAIPLVAVMTRSAHKFSPSRIKDNDNTEAGRILNAIMSKIGYSDNPLNLSVYSNFKEDSEFEGVTFYFFSRSDLPNNLDIL